MNRRTIYLIAALLAVGVLASGYFYVSKSSSESSENYITAEVQRGDVSRTVSSTGVLQAVVTVQVGSQVSGRIQELYADFNSVVSKGQTLAVIDPANFEAARERARASLATAEAAVRSAEATQTNRDAERVSSIANLEVARVSEAEARRQHRRAQELFTDNLVPEQDLENSKALLDQAAARVRQAEAQVRQADATIRSAKAQREQAAANVQQARAELKMADVNLRYTTITSPIDGVVIERNVDIGQTVAASFQAPLLFLIANDLSKMQVIAQIDEADIGAISEQATVEFTVDAFPNDVFQGKISEIRLSSKLPASSTPSQTSTGSGNVVVYNVIIDVENPQLKLRPSMTANVNFTVASVENVLKIPNAAIRYRPPRRTAEETARLLPLSPSVGADTGRATIAETAAYRGEPAGTEFRGGKRGRRGSKPPDDSAGNGGQPVIAPSRTAQYGIEAGLKIHFPEAQQRRPVPGVVWILDAAGQAAPKRVLLGITDGRETAVLGGALEEDDRIILGEIGNEETSVEIASPFGGVGQRRGRR